MDLSTDFEKANREADKIYEETDILIDEINTAMTEAKKLGFISCIAERRRLLEIKSDAISEFSDELSSR